jgi:hypothetical protein
MEWPINNILNFSDAVVHPSRYAQMTPLLYRTLNTISTFISLQVCIQPRTVHFVRISNIIFRVAGTIYGLSVPSIRVSAIRLNIFSYMKREKKGIALTNMLILT